MDPQATPLPPPAGRRRWLRAKAGKILAIGTGFLVAVAYFGFVLPFWGIPFNQSRHGRVPLTPPWALECWLWEDDSNTAAAVTELLEGYARHDVPVRTIMIDSPWSERYNDFKVDESRYPDPAGFFLGLQERGYRVVLWMTCMVNSLSKDTKIRQSQDFFAEAQRAGYLAGNGFKFRWWKGEGGFIDYSNSDARRWWQNLQEQVLQWGIDGWKLDGADTFFSGRIAGIPVPFNRTRAGWTTTRSYMDWYAREELRHGLSRNPDFTTLIRAVDHPWYHPEGFAPLDAAPVTWVGDNRHTWRREDRGLEAALTDILNSARIGYCVIGSDVAGYHGRSNPDDMAPATAAMVAQWAGNGSPVRDGNARMAEGDPIAPNIYIRWAEFSAFCGLFLNGGHGDRRLWRRSAAELEIVRKYSWLHTELVPYLYSHVVECHRGGKPLMRPLPQGRYHYLLGDDFLVAPIYEDKSTREVALPAGRWRYFFNPLGSSVAGPAILTRDFPLDEYPVFLREGAIVPLNVSRNYTGLGDRESAGFRTWLIEPGGENRFTLWHPETHPQPEATTVTMKAGATLRLTFAGRHEPHLLRIRATAPPRRVLRDGGEVPADREWRYDASRHALLIRTLKYEQGEYEIEW
jgi:alpha-D-xyloside xylohydrolase